MPSATDVFESTTNAIVTAIEQGAGTWQMPWLVEGSAFPWNPTTGKRYRGGNVLTLWAQSLGAGYEAGEWATYKQWASLGAQVLRGERGTGCVFWKVTTSSKDEETGEQVDDGRRRFVARGFTVFHCSQVDGYTPKLTGRDSPAQIETAERFFAWIGAAVEHRSEGRAYYSPAQDLIVLPPFATFIDASGYYATRAHDPLDRTPQPARSRPGPPVRFGCLRG